MSRLKNTIWCDGCGEKISWTPLINDECHYCCQSCLEGLPCKCYRLSELELDHLEEQSEVDNDYY